MSKDKVDYKSVRTPFVFLDETGSINDKVNRFFGLGIIKCMQPYFLDSSIRLLRQKMQTFDELKWNTISEQKLPFIENVIDLVFNIPGINFCCYVVDKSNVDFEKEFNNDPYFAYQKFSEDLIDESIEENEILCVLADYISTPNGVKYEVDLKHTVNERLNRLAVAGVHRIDSKGSNLLQVVDLLLGAVVYEYKLQNNLVKGDKNKIKVLKMISKRLKVGSLKQVKLRKFKVKQK